MSFQKIKTVAGNTAPPLTFFAKRDGQAISLTGASAVDLYLVDKLSGGTQTNTGHESCTIVDAPTGSLSYVRQTGDIPVAGTYYGDVLVTYTDTTDEVLNDILLVVARARLAGE